MYDRVEKHWGSLIPSYLFFLNSFLGIHSFKSQKRILQAKIISFDEQRQFSDNINLHR